MCTTLRRLAVVVSPVRGRGLPLIRPMPRTVTRTLLLGSVLLATLALVQPAGAADVRKYLAPPSACPGQTNAGAKPAVKVRAMRCLLNHAREKRGLAELRWHAKLHRAAALKLRDNVRCDEFSHTACGEPFISVFRRSRYVTSSTRSYSVGENLAWGQGRLGTPRRIVLAWLRSDGHRHNLFSRAWRDMGVAYRLAPRFEGHERVALWANCFGRRSF
jgi:uncharacterized protein YkwD